MQCRYCFRVSALNRFDESKANLEKLLAASPVGFDIHRDLAHQDLYEIALIKGDTSAMQQQLAWANARPNNAAQFFWQGNFSAFFGQLRKAREFYEQGIAIQQSQNKNFAADNAALAVLGESVAGNCQRVNDNAEKALAMAHSELAMWRSAIALGLCHQTGQLQPLIDQIAKGRPKDTVINSVVLPQMRAAIEIDATTPERLNSWNRPRPTLARSLTNLISIVISLVLCGPSICAVSRT